MNCDVERISRDHEAAHEVAAPDFEDAAGDGVEEHVEPEDLAVERLAAVRPLQDQEDHEGVDRQVDLRRVERDAEGRADGVVAKGSVKVTPKGPWVSFP